MNFLVTGGSRGIGAEIVRQALAAGHDVAFTYRKSSEAAAEIVREGAGRLGRHCRAYELDVASSSQVETVIDRVLADFRTIDVVVPNAGINRNALAMAMTDDDWNEVLQTNLSGAFYVVRQVLPVLVENRFGRIVFISSLSRFGLSGQANYAASKAALIGLSGTLAREYGHRGITSNVIAPGLIETDLTRENMSELHAKHWATYNPTRRLGTAAEVAAVALFLASRAASYVNGACIGVTAGLDWAP